MSPRDFPGQGSFAFWNGGIADFPALPPDMETTGQAVSAGEAPSTVFIASGRNVEGKELLDEALKKRIPFVVLGADWPKRVPSKILQKAASAGVRIIGPGSAGIITPRFAGDGGANTALLAEGRDAFLCTLSAARRRGVPFRYALSFGEKAGYPLLEAAGKILEKDPAVELFVFLVKILKEGRDLLDFAALAARQGKRTALLQLFREEGRAGDECALLRQYDIEILEEPLDIVDGAAVFLRSARPGGKRVHCLSPSREFDMLLRREAAAFGFECCGEREDAHILLEMGGSSPVPVREGQAYVRTLTDSCHNDFIQMCDGPPTIPGVRRSIRAIQLATYPRKSTMDELRSRGPAAICSVRGKVQWDAKAFLRAYGVPIAKEKLCSSFGAAAAAAEEIGYPVALKVMSPSILYKTEARVIALNLHDEEELRNAYGRTLEKARLADPKANIRGVLVQEMIFGGTEWRMEFHRDSCFGAVVEVGISGAYRDFLPDRVIRSAPFDEDEAMEVIRGSKGYPLLLEGWRRPALDVESFASALSSFSRLAYCESKVSGIEVHPLFVNVSGVLVVDAFIETKGARRR